VAAADLAASLQRLDARELVTPPGSEPLLAAALPGVMVTPREVWEFDRQLASEDLQRRFGLASLDGLGIEPADAPALAAAGALFRYASELRPGGIPQLARPAVRRDGSVVPLDEMTRRNLELVEPLRAWGGGAGASQNT